MNALATSDDLRHVWFGEPSDPPLAGHDGGDPQTPGPAGSKKWFAKDDAFDRALRDQFEPALDAAVRGELPGWRSSGSGRVALIVLLDQVSRNIFRGSPRSFAQDEMARALTLEMLARGEDRERAPIERYFVLMPLMHAEDVALQERCVAEFEILLAEAPEGLKSLFVSAVDYAKRHAVIVERFGRFPHRNAILGRASTPEEVEFLKQPGSSF